MADDPGQSGGGYTTGEPMRRYLLAWAVFEFMATPTRAASINFESYADMLDLVLGDNCTDPDQPCNTYYSVEGYGAFGDSNGAISRSVGRQNVGATISFSAGGAVAAAASVAPGGPFAPYQIEYPYPPYPDPLASGVYSDLSYNFEVIGPSASDVSVPAIIHSYVNLVTSGNGRAFTTFGVYGITNDIPFLAHLNSANGDSSSPIHFNDPVNLLTNHIYQVYMIADAYNDYGTYTDPYLVPYSPGFDNSGSAYAFVDPAIDIDPAYAAQYHIYGGLLGPPIPAASGTPEPATWALLVAGFGLVGAAVRRRVVA